MLLGYLRAGVPMWLVYLALTGNVRPTNLVAGAVIAAFVTYLTSPPAWNVAVRDLPGVTVTGARYVYLLVIDIIKCGWRVAKAVVDPTLPIEPVWRASAVAVERPRRAPPARG